jgi:hypothetical protein
VERHGVIHWLIVNGLPVENSTAEMAISAAVTEEQQATVAVAMALVIAAVQGGDLKRRIASGVRLESVLPVAVKLARAIDLAAREIAALVEIALGVATWEAVPGVDSETVPDTAPAMPAPVATGVRKA